ncbi:hypothetical protein HYU16_00810 [Candidatus Woesearchaeota archaeon]|nr:hypothetical protein [Candidatus Woesearchaeota archaeon]
MPDYGLAELKREAKFAVAAFIAATIIFKIAYYKEGLIEVVKTTASLFWLFVIPGYALTFYWREKLGFVERTVAGTVAAMAVSGVASYYLGLAGLKIQNQTILLPAAVIALSLALSSKFWARKSQQQQGQKPQ